MLNLIRRVNFPQTLQTSGYVIKASVLKHVSCYREIVEQANLEAQKILSDARAEAQTIRDCARQDAIQELNSELQTMSTLVRKQGLEFKESAARVCMEICNTVLESMISAADERVKMRILIDSLLQRIHSARELHLIVHPDHHELTQSVFAEILGTQFDHRKCVVETNEEMKQFEIKITTSNGAEISVSIENLLLMYKQEIDSLGSDIEQVFQNTEVEHEVTD